MTDQELLNSKFSYVNSAHLSALSKDDLVNQVIEFLDATSSGDSFIDFDKLMAAGITLAKLQRTESSAAVVDWILSDSATRRVDVGCAFLAGLWHPGFSKGNIDQASAAKLMDSLQLTGISKDAISSFTFSVYQASLSKNAAEIKDSLVAAGKRIESQFAADKLPKEIEMQLKMVYEKASG